MAKLLYLIIAFGFISSTAVAQYINIDADDRVEWDSNAQKITAIGNAIASKKDMQIRADQMTAYYAKNTSPKAKNATSVSEVHAKGGVVMTSSTAKAYGDTMDYDVAKDSMILVGQPAKIVTDKEVITAKENITYYPSLQKAIALGDVFAQDQKKNKIYSDKMIAFFKKNDTTGSLDMEKIEIYGNVRIRTSNAKVNADKGIYLPSTGVVKLYDHVVIDQDGNKLNGDFAETNLKTGISKLIAGKTSQGRVSGIFKEKKKEEPKKASSTASKKNNK